MALELQRYEVLHYPGDLTGREELAPGRLLAHDEVGRPYEVIDTEYEPGDWPDWPGRTTVNLQYAGSDALKAEMARRGETNA